MTNAGSLDPLQIGALVALVNQDRLPEAESRARALLAIHPGAGMLWKILSVTLVRQGKDALTELRRTAELMPQDAEAHRNLGAALHDQGQWAQALASLRRALAVEPNDADTLVDAANATKELRRANEAVPLYQRALQLNPRLVEAHNNLGNAYLELGRYLDAAACYRLALGIKPDDAQILCNLGDAQRRLGMLDQAMISTQRAIAIDPALSAAHHNLGNLLRDFGRRRDAVTAFRKAIELEPGHADSHCDLGTALFELRRIDAAVASFRQALAIKADHAPAHLSLGLALRQLRRPEDAQACCETALAINPNYVEALSFLGELWADRGRFSEAEGLFRRAIAINPDFAPAYAGIATHRNMTDEDAAWLTGASTALAKRLPLAHEISLRYALGKYFDDTKRYEEAFGHYRQANELTKRYGSRYEGAKLTRRIDEIIGLFDADFLRQCEACASDSRLPVLIVGMPRSGTSLTEQILASHPAAFGAGEVIFWNGAYDAYRDARGQGRSPADLLPGLARDYLARLTALSAGAARIVDKMPANFMYAGLIHAALPQARIIHMRRHPIDTCLSIYFQNFFNIGPYANDFDHLAHYYREYLRITDHWRTVLPEAALLEVPYEALVADQEGWTRRMLEFIGLPWDPGCLDFHRTDRVVITASKWQVRQKIHAASAGRWKNYEKFLGPLQGLIAGAG